MNIIYKKTIPDIDILLNLYTNAGWSAYLKSPEKLLAALQNSQDIISAWDGEKLVGLIRSVGDKHTILYIQDILVLSSYKRKGIGTALVKMLLENYPDIRQVVLLTDNNIESKKFYESVSFNSSEELNTICFVKIKKAS